MPSARAISIMDVHMSLCLLLRQMLAEEGEHLAPAIHRLFRPIEWPVPIEDAVAGTIVAVELVRLAVLFQFRLVLVDLFGRRRPIVVAEYADEGATEVFRHVDRRHRRLGVEFFLPHHHPSAPEFGAGVDVLSLAGIDEGVPAAGAGAENP